MSTLSLQRRSTTLTAPSFECVSLTTSAPTRIGMSSLETTNGQQTNKTKKLTMGGDPFYFSRDFSFFFFLLPSSRICFHRPLNESCKGNFIEWHWIFFPSFRLTSLSYFSHLDEKIHRVPK